MMVASHHDGNRMWLLCPMYLTLKMNFKGNLLHAHCIYAVFHVVLSLFKKIGLGFSLTSYGEIWTNFLISEIFLFTFSFFLVCKWNNSGLFGWKLKIILQKKCFLWDGWTSILTFNSPQTPGFKYVIHRELCSMLCGSLDGRGIWGEWMHIWLRPFADHLKLSQHC